jgi:uncharacterized protein (TIGR03083 family)
MTRDILHADLWAATHTARRSLADDLRLLSRAQWQQRTLCAQWRVEDVVAHLTAVASVGRLRWIASIVSAGFRPAVHNDRRLREHLGGTPEETLRRFEAVVGSTTAPTRDTAAYLGEVLVHSQDIRQPLGIATQPDPAALVAVAEFYSCRDFTVSSRSLTSGLRLRGTDSAFVAGDGPEVAGPTLALVMTMAGRRAYLDQLEGPGLTTVADRIG